MKDIVSLSSRASRRFVRWILGFLGVVILVIVVANNVTYQLVRKPGNVELAQMIYGWARLYKPMIFDSVKPQLVSFGYSWVRDIFDPVRARHLTGKTFFNFGVSGASSFESRRFIQNMLAIHRPEAVFLDLESFADAPRARLTEPQFDERILYVKRDGTPNRWAGFNRFVKINTSGAALGFNWAFLKTLYQVRKGVPRESLLPSFQRRNWANHPKDVEKIKRWMSQPRPFPSATENPVPTLQDLEASVRMLCNAGVDIHLYNAPYICNWVPGFNRKALALMHRLQKDCKSQITFHDFHYPNAATMEGLIIPNGQSLFYRPNIHPRPSLGQLMLTRILNLQDKPGAPSLPTDFGVDLMQMSTADAGAWLDERDARCYGQWKPGKYQATLDEAKTLHNEWRKRF